RVPRQARDRAVAAHHVARVLLGLPLLRFERRARGGERLGAAPPLVAKAVHVGERFAREELRIGLERARLFLERGAHARRRADLLEPRLERAPLRLHDDEVRAPRAALALVALGRE